MVNVYQSFPVASSGKSRIFYLNLRLKLCCQGYFFYENQWCCTSMRDLNEGRTEMREKSPEPGRIRAQDLSVIRPALYRSATAAAPTFSKLWFLIQDPKSHASTARTRTPSAPSKAASSSTRSTSERSGKIRKLPDVRWKVDRPQVRVGPGQLEDHVRKSGEVVQSTGTSPLRSGSGCCLARSTGKDLKFN